MNIYLGLIMTYWTSAFTEYFIYNGNNISFGYQLHWTIYFAAFFFGVFIPLATNFYSI